MKNRHLINAFVVVLLLAGTSCFASSKELTEFEQAAQRALPELAEPYNYPQILEIFTPVLHPKTKVTFESYFQIMYREDFPQPKHNPASIIKFYRCLHASLAEANVIEKEAEKVEKQHEELYKRLFFHKGLIAKFNQDLAAKIAGFPCESCIKTARGEIMGMDESDDCYK